MTKEKIAKKVTKPVPKEEKVKVEKTEEVVEKPKRKKRQEIDRSELILCRSTTHGNLIYLSPRSGAKYVWDDYGSELDLEMGELVNMNGSQNRKFLQDGYLVIDDEEAAEYLGLTKIYEQLAHLDNLDKLFSKSVEEMFEIVPRLPKSMKITLASKAREMIEDGSLDSIGRINALEKLLGVDLKDFIQK